jgi:5'-nucleotidase (lipoprotein e(P4) family)
MKKYLLGLSVICCIACNNNTDQIQILQAKIDSLEKASSCRNSEYLMQSVLWFQRSPEIRALYLQSYQIAREALDLSLKHPAGKKPKAVVVDIDETILDNSPYEGWLIAKDSSFSSVSWNSWINDAAAEPLPGALDFLNYAKKKGCQIFYISNRKKEGQFEATLKNLVSDKFPDADASHLLLKTPADTGSSAAFTSKEQRRLTISQQLNYEIVLLCGDQLADFDKAFNLYSSADENSIKDSLKKYSPMLGKRFFMMPNPMYGDWLSLITFGPSQRGSCSYLDSLRKNQIKKWKE